MQLPLLCGKRRRLPAHVCESHHLLVFHVIILGEIGLDILFKKNENEKELNIENVLKWV